MGFHAVILSYPLILALIALPALAVGFITYVVSSQVNGDADLAFHGGAIASIVAIVAISISLIVSHAFNVIAS